MDRDDLSMMVAGNIQTVMDRQGLNAFELARRAKLNATGVYDILSGKSRSPRLDTICKIARALSVPVALLFEDHTDAELRLQIIQAIEKRPEEERRRILVAARAWASEFSAA